MSKTITNRFVSTPLIGSHTLPTGHILQKIPLYALMGAFIGCSDRQRKTENPVVVQTNLVLFPYGLTTETNALGWKMIGRFK